MEREKLLQNPLPIDRVAARVTRAAKPEDLWRPMPKQAPEMVTVATTLPTAPIPWTATNANPALKALPGKRRDRMVIVGYAADQGAGDKTARWVVRCDCGNYEHRTRIFRWLGTVAADMCRECRVRTYKLRGEWAQREKATRMTHQLTGAERRED